MSDKQPELTPNQSDDDSDADGQDGQDVQNPPAVPDVVQMGDDEYKLVPLSEIEQNDCGCDHGEVERELEQAKEELENYKSLVDEFKQQRRSRLSDRITQLNSELPSDVAWEDEEVEQMCAEEDLSVLQAQAETMERLAPKRKAANLNQSEEDLSGSSGNSGDDENAEMEERINQVSEDLFGRSINEVLEDTPENRRKK